MFSKLLISGTLGTDSFPSFSLHAYSGSPNDAPMWESEPPILGDSRSLDPRSYTRATVNMMKAVYTGIEEIKVRRRLIQKQERLRSTKKNRPKRRLRQTLTQMLDSAYAYQLSLDEFIKKTDMAEKRIAEGKIHVEGNKDLHVGHNDGKKYVLTHHGITGEAHGTFERVAEVDDNGNTSMHWTWTSDDHCPTRWYILDSPDEVAEMMIFINRKSKIAILAFRGSESEITDWKTNFDAFTGSLHMIPHDNDEEYISVKGHEGFIEAFNQNRDWIKHALKHHIPEDYKIIITGHSQGAGICYIAALVITIETGRKVDYVIPFASPQMAYADMKQLYEEKVGCNGTMHFWNNWDPVPRVPPYMDRPCEGTRSSHELSCDFSFWKFWKCHYSDTYQAEIRRLMDTGSYEHWNVGCQATDSVEADPNHPHEYIIPDEIFKGFEEFL